MKSKKISPNFEDLQISTCTIVVYSNVELNLKSVFKSFPVKLLRDVPLTKKKKNVDKAKIKAQDGDIISCRWGDYLRGIQLKIERFWCVVCCPVTVKKYGKKVYPKTVHKTYEPYKRDIKKAIYTCKLCHNVIPTKNLGKIPDFLNQITLVMYLKGRFLNIMIFKNKFKMVGFKDEMDSVYVINTLFKTTLTKKSLWSSIDGEHPLYIFFTAMKNFDFKLGFPIDVISLNNVMNKEEYDHMIFMCQRESARGSSVNIKFYTEQPDDYRYTALTYKNDQPIISFLRENILKKTPTKKKYITFIVFSSSEVILSGRYKDMRDAYNFFLECIQNNKSEILERITEPKFDLSSLKLELGIK
ncbi:MAG TPA: hypothetical protein VLE02_01070 [Nitrosarchaeum sp.]|nr:hypothetical protein [Nitrosarchaeum sp.]